MNYPKLFDKQPPITNSAIADFERRGLVTPLVTLHESQRRTANISNPSAGDVVGYFQLAGKLKDGAISQADARALLCIEAARKKGPRDSHVSRLLLVAFSEDRASALEKIRAFAKGVASALSQGITDAK